MRMLNWLRVQWYRSSLGTVSSYVALLVAGVLIGVYWTDIADCIRSAGIGGAIWEHPAVVSAGVAIVVFWWQVNRARYNQRIDLILKLVDRFERAEMRAFRARAAIALRKNPDTQDGSVGEVLNLFEDIGFLLNERAIDDKVVYEFFEYWMIPYYQATNRYREKVRARYPDVYCNLDRLFDVLTCLERSRTGKKPDRSHIELDEFLSEESLLVPPIRTRITRQRGRR